MQAGNVFGPIDAAAVFLSVVVAGWGLVRGVREGDNESSPRMSPHLSTTLEWNSRK
jgi:hypothetical protein